MQTLVPKFFRDTEILNNEQKNELLIFYNNFGFKIFNKYKSYFNFLLKLDYKKTFKEAIDYKNFGNKKASNFYKEDYIFLFGKESKTKRLQN